jgi:hypothetical protein
MISSRAFLWRSVGISIITQCRECRYVCQFHDADSGVFFFVAVGLPGVVLSRSFAVMHLRNLLFRKLLLALALGAPLVSACKTRTFQSGDASVKIRIKNNDTGITEPFDVNDVSILIPFEMARTSPEFAMSNFMTQAQLNDVLKVSESDPMKNFANAGSISPVQFSDPSQIISNWHIVSLRVDTCAPGAHFAATLASGDQATRDRLCAIQIRLIAQPFPNNSEEDVTFHLLYNQPKNEESLKSLLRGLDKVRSAAGGKTKGAPLGVHPGLADANTAAATRAVSAQHSTAQHSTAQHCHSTHSTDVRCQRS